MILKHKILLAMGIIASTFVAAGFASTPTYALDQYLQISPTSEHVTLEPGTTHDGQLKVRNIGNDEFDYRMGMTPFSVIGEDYRSDFETESNYTKIASWISFDKETGTLAPNEENVINYHIEVPNDAPGGGQYAAIVATIGNNAADEEDGANIKTVSRAALVLYGRVNGETNDCGEILSNNIPMFLFDPPITVSSTVHNCGNVDNEAKFSLKIWPLFSNEEVYTSENDEKMDKDDLVLPDTKRYHAMTWEKTPSFGIFNVEQTIEYAGKTDTNKKLVIIFPLWLIIVFIALIGAIIFWLVSRAQKRKQDRRGN